MNEPRKLPILVFLLNVGQRSVERWLEGRPNRPAALTSGQARALFYLARNDGAPIGKVAEALAIGAPAMSALANRMEQAGLVVRRRDTADGRSIRLCLTEKGWQTMRRAQAELAALNAKLTEGFSEAEIAIVARWLEPLPRKLATPPPEH
ncbi:MAG: winged helix-turn-helix transcriptional regulator [Xanthomonadaceae bacterium]|nr:winged helix-turn-helix transcriptional regulator [Xanthomonadaceae bacterium]